MKFTFLMCAILCMVFNTCSDMYNHYHYLLQNIVIILQRNPE